MLAGAIFENNAVSQVCAGYLNLGRECPMWYYWDSDAREIKFVVHQLDLSIGGIRKIREMGQADVLDALEELGKAGE